MDEYKKVNTGHKTSNSSYINISLKRKRFWACVNYMYVSKSL